MREIENNKPNSTINFQGIPKPAQEEPVEEKPTDYPYPKRPNLLKRVWNLLREKEEEDMRIVQLDYVA